MRKSAGLNLSSYDFWELDESKLFHYDHHEFRSLDDTVFLSPHKLSNYMLRYIKHGEGFAAVDHVNYKIEPNTVFVGNPEQVRWFDVPKDMRLKSYFISFKKELFSLMNIEGIEGLVTNFGRVPLIKVPEDQQDFIKNIFKLLIQIPQSSSTYHNKLVASITHTLILSLYSINPEEQPRTKAQQNYLVLYRLFIDQLNMNYKKSHLTSDYAELLNIPQKRLSRACKSVSGKTAGEIISDRLDFEAKRLLYYSANSAKEISYELGFRDPTHFNKFFKAKNGEAPNGYRKRMRQFV